ncbi:MAG TPA: cysteine dioxygenase [Eoetvoesiella sp.]
MKNNRLLTTVSSISNLVARHGLQESDALQEAARAMQDLVAVDDWLPGAMALPHPDYYRQYLLYGDPLDRFSLVSFVWGPGQKTPVHDHTVWGVIGMLRGTEASQPYTMTPQGLAASGPEELLTPGQVTCVAPSIGDIHSVRNASEGQVSISIHLYGGNIGRVERSVYVPGSTERKLFISGYSNQMAPNLWAPQE